MPYEDFSIVYSGNIVQADLLKCLLEGQGIQTWLADEFLGMIAPWYAAPGGAGAVKVLIARSDMDQAHTMVEDFAKNGPPTGQKWRAFSRLVRR